VLSKFAMFIGSVSVGVPTEDNIFIDDLTIIELDIAAVNAGKSKGVKPIDFAKVWRIDVETTRRSIEVTTQLKQQDDDGCMALCLGIFLRMTGCSTTAESIVISLPIHYM